MSSKGLRKSNDGFFGKGEKVKKRRFQKLQKRGHFFVYQPIFDLNSLFESLWKMIKISVEKLKNLKPFWSDCTCKISRI